MQVGSLIFVVIVAIWAAYLLQHWVRRREDAAATRSVEGFSQAMRVLEKRPLLPHTELRAPRPNSYAVKPASLSRATVDVKRAVPAGAARASSPLVARRASDHLEEPLQVQPEIEQHEIDQHEIDQQHPSDTHSGEVDRMPVSHSPAPRDRGRGSDRPVPSSHARAPHREQARPEQSRAVHHRPEQSRPDHHRSERDRTEQSRPAPHRVSMAQRRLRAALLLVALLWLPVSTVLAITGVLLWVSVPFALVTLVAVLYWLRTEAQADRAHRAEQRSGASDARGDQRRRGAAPSPVLSSEDTQVISHRAIEEARRAAETARRQRHDPREQQPAHHERHDQRETAEAGPAHQPAAIAAAHATAYAGVFDVQAAQTGGVPVAPAPAAVVELEPGSWSPVPVPVPTYALKAKAEPRYTDDGIPTDVFDTPEFADEAEELDDRALFARRAVSG